MPRPFGYKVSEKTKKKISSTRKRLGLKPLPYERNANIKFNCSVCHKEYEVIFSRRNKTKYCSMVCAGIGKSDQARENLKKVDKERLRKINSKRLVGRCGDRSLNWKGGITPINTKIRNSKRYAKWRKKVFERDGYKCVLCGYDKGHILEADHIKEFSRYPKLRFLLKNGRTLCKPCHKKTDNYFGKIRYKK